MSYYCTCPHCGANLDPGEVCDCQIGAALLLIEGAAEQWAPAKSQTIGNLDKKTAPSATNTEDGKQTPPSSN